MALSSNSKKGLALGALLPVLLSIYSESRQQAETQAQRAAAHIEARQKHREAVQARDLDGAQKFLVQVTGDGADPDDSHRDGSFCDHVYIASELVRLTLQSTATQAAVIGALQYRSEAPAAVRGKPTAASLPPRICDCPLTLAQLQSNWRPGKKGTLADPAVIREMAATLDATAAKCDDENADVEAGIDPPETNSPETNDPVASSPSATMSATHDAEPACAPTPAGDDTPARVYIQIARENQRGAAVMLQGRLRGDGYIVPGIERVGASASPAQMQVRYVFSEDCAEARKLRDDVQIAAPERAPELTAPLSQYRAHSLRRSFEVWFPRQPSPTRDSP